MEVENQNSEIEEISDSSVPAILDGKKFFKITHREKNNPDKVKASCLMCSFEKRNTIISGSLRATTNFKTHMKRLHTNVVEEFEKYKEDNKVSGARRKRRSDTNLQNLPSSTGKQLKLVDMNISTQKLSRQQKFNQNVTNYVVQSMKPLSTVDNISFTKIFQDLDPTLQIMSRRTLGRRIDDAYDFIQKKLKETFQATNYISTTADIWSTKHRSFMGVTAHWARN